MRTPRNGLGLTRVCGAACFVFGLLFLANRHRTAESQQQSLVQSVQDAEEGVDASPYYDWKTSSKFTDVQFDDIATPSNTQLCTGFPKHLLEVIQPVLKTGHGVVETRLKQSLRTHSACLDSLLIFSDMDEVVDGKTVIDVIADIPAPLRQNNDTLTPYTTLQEHKLNGTLHEWKPDRETAWRIDRFKFVPALSRAWRMRPEKKWYVFYEDDTYIVWDTVFRLLENFDADVPLYFGSPSPQSEGQWFANGGPGYIISRGAMRKLVQFDYDPVTGVYLTSHLSAAYWDEIVGNCCGDSTLGIVLRDHEVPLQGLWPLFNPHPLHGLPFSDLHWCQPVLSLHKSLDEDVVKFWRWEWKNRDPWRPILYRDIALKFLQVQDLQRRDDWDTAEWDAFEPDGEAAHDSAESCASECKWHEGCFQWTYHRRHCSFVRSIRLGRARAPDTDENDEWDVQEQRYISGWNRRKIINWTSERLCEKVEWVKPSTERIF